MRTRESIHALKRRLLRRMNTVPSWKAVEIAMTVREHAIACRFSSGYSITAIASDDKVGGAAWDSGRVETAIRRRTEKRR